jgi:hypothetical protein
MYRCFVLKSFDVYLEALFDAFMQLIWIYIYIYILISSLVI